MLRSSRYASHYINRVIYDCCYGFFFQNRILDDVICSGRESKREERGAFESPIIAVQQQTLVLFFLTCFIITLDVPTYAIR